MALKRLFAFSSGRLKYYSKSVSAGLLQAFHVDDKTVFHIALEQALVGLVDVLDINHFHFGHDIVRAAEIKHFLRFGDAADQRAGHAAAAENQWHGAEGGFQIAHQAHQHQCAIER